MEHDDGYYSPRPVMIMASEAVRRIEASSLRVQQPASSGDLVSLVMGEPDFDTPVQIPEAAAQALAEGYTHYSPLRGEPDLLEALAEQVGGLLGTAASASDMIVTRWHRRTGRADPRVSQRR